MTSMRVLTILIEVVSAFLLAVEAIKLDNLNKLRESIRHGGHAFFPIEVHRVSLHGVYFVFHKWKFLFLFLTFGVGAFILTISVSLGFYKVNLLAQLSSKLAHA